MTWKLFVQQFIYTHTPVMVDFTCLCPSLNHLLALFSEAMLDWVGGHTHFSDSNFKDLTNVYFVDFFFLSLLINNPLPFAVSIWVTLGPWESKGQLLIHSISCKSKPGHLA